MFRRFAWCFELIGATYTDWTGNILWGVRRITKPLPLNRQHAPLIGSELDAAMNVHRW